MIVVDDFVSVFFAMFSNFGRLVGSILDPLGEPKDAKGGPEGAKS